MAEKALTQVQVTARNKFELNKIQDKYQQHKCNDYVSGLGTKVSYEGMYTPARQNTVMSSTLNSYRRGSQEAIKTDRLNVSVRMPQI